jgi:hypothetical protein
MKLIASRNYYQKKNWERVEIDRAVKNETLRMTPEEKAANDLEAKAQWERIYAKYEEMSANTIVVRNPLTTLFFRWASKAALGVAENFELNVTVEEGSDTGFIRFKSDQVLSERIWNDQKYRNQLLRMMRWADGVWIDTVEEYDEPLIQISLSYKTTMSIKKKK